MGLLLNVLGKPGEFHPYIDLNHCINRRQRWLECHACADICPKQVYDLKQTEKPKWTECQNCGLCVSACSTRCIAPSTPNVNRQLKLTNPDLTVVISCKEHEVNNSHTEPCISILPWEYLAYLALGKKLVLNLTGCQTCPHTECVELLRKQLLRLKEFLGEEEYAQRVDVRTQEAKEGEEEKLSRRDLFRKGFQKTVQTTSLMVNDTNQEHINGLAYRSLLADRIRTLYKESKPEERKSYTMRLPWFGTECYGCGNCVKLCPNHALEISEESEGKRLISITPWKCVGCGVCNVVCRDHGIQGIHSVKVPYLDKLPMVKVDSASCARCGRAMRPGRAERYCASCKQKIR